MEQGETVHDPTFEEICEIVAPIAIKHGMLRVYLFGSRARGNHNKDSDFDFCILAPKEYGLFKIGSFRCDLEDALGKSVDIVSEEGTNRPYFTEELLRDRRLVYEAQR